MGCTYNIALALTAVLVLFTGAYSDYPIQVTYEEPLPLVIGGRPIPIDEVPYQVGIFLKIEKVAHETEYSFCGGSILSAIFILTAAHCVDTEHDFSRNKHAPAKLTVGIFYGTDLNLVDIGSNMRGILDPDTYILVSSIHIHPEWERETLENDIAVLMLENPIPFSPVAQPVALQADQPRGGEIARLTGWGKKTPTGPVPVLHLQQTNMTILDGKSCVQYLIGLLSSAPSVTASLTTSAFSKHICAGSSDGNSCEGDSGGPLAIGNRQIGIVSFGAIIDSLCYTSSPAAFTSVAAYRSFIDHMTSHTAVWV